MPSPRMFCIGTAAVPLFAILTLPSAIPVTLAATPNTPILLAALPRMSLSLTTTWFAVSGTGRTSRAGPWCS